MACHTSWEQGHRTNAGCSVLENTNDDALGEVMPGLLLNHRDTLSTVCVLLSR